ncbi:hypothetical protein [Chryseobacterium herbae]|uniref:Uncharacterized protein n=1 Tax=Chryseobacterium herbae TaxID=2976476 RepID=A0ABT2ITE3_9FLAO|nr:hypothetical protein [Chryseobacterium sp. pc1-10]MCT2561920.1 hypothetical protein [Chryseobacterium sp. pc1-10]
MKKILFCVLLSQALFSQVGIGNTDPKGALDMRGTATTNLGLVLPQTSNVGNVTTPKGTPVLEGTLVWDNQDQCVKFKTASAWSKCMASLNDIPDPGALSSLSSILADGKTPVRVKRDTKGYPLFSSATTGLGYVNEFNSNMYGAGANKITYPCLTNKVGANINPTFVTTLKFVSLSMGGYPSVSDEYLFSVGVTDAGDVYTVGSNEYGQLGRPVGIALLDYTKVNDAIEGLAANEKIIKVIAGGADIALLSNQGNVYMAGSTRYGQAGNGSNANDYQPTFKKILFRTDDGTTAADKFITNIFSSSTMGQSFSAVSSTNKLFAWGRIFGTGLITNKPSTTADYDGNFGETFQTVGYDSQETTYATNVTRTFDTADQILVGSTVKKFIVGIGNSFLLLEDGRLFGLGYTTGLSDPYITSDVTTYTTSPTLMNAVLYPQGNYTNTSPLADDHKIIDMSFSTVNQSGGGFVYAGNIIGNSGGYSSNNGFAYSMVITKKELFMKGYNYTSTSWGSRLGNNWDTPLLPLWTKFDKSATEFSNAEYVAVDAHILRSTIAIKSPGDSNTAGVRLYSSGHGKFGEAGSSVKDGLNGISMIYKAVTY